MVGLEFALKFEQASAPACSVTKLCRYLYVPAHVIVELGQVLCL